METATAIKLCDCCSSVATVGSRCKDCVGLVACLACGDWEDWDKARGGLCRSCLVECDGCGWQRSECTCCATPDPYAKYDDDEPIGDDVDDISW